mmetsp:Transcript_32820/g.94259  ORF Transcript_32820/g.94259 Transcript_32820/m.94259 type:complete len:204 (+) Transcript_32820:35-646(+)
MLVSFGPTSCDGMRGKRQQVQSRSHTRSSDRGDPALPLQGPALPPAPGGPARAPRRGLRAPGLRPRRGRHPAGGHRQGVLHHPLWRGLSARSRVWRWQHHSAESDRHEPQGWRLLRREGAGARGPPVRHRRGGDPAVDAADHAAEVQGFGLEREAPLPSPKGLGKESAKNQGEGANKEVSCGPALHRRSFEAQREPSGHGVIR